MTDSPKKTTQGKEILILITLIIVGTYFFIHGIISASGFLIPLSISVMVTLICVPLARKLERLGLSRGLSSLMCVLVTLGIFVSFFVLISLQFSQFSDRWPEIKSKAKTGIEKVEKYVSSNTGFSFQGDIDKLLSITEADTTQGEPKFKEKPADSSDNSTAEQTKADEESSSLNEVPSGVYSKASSFLIGFFGFLGNSILVMIYLFFLLLYRTKIKLSILNFFDKSNQENVKEVLSNTVHLALDFLVGRMTLILFLAILYSIGLSLSGIENAILISLLAAILSLIPYVGNLIGILLAIFMATIAGGTFGMYTGIAITFTIAQFVESYILEPYLVGGKVHVNPFVTILVVVLGGTIWGVAGMILAIPMIGIVKVICDTVPALKPIGYFLGEEDLENENDKPGLLSRWGKKIWSKFSS